MEAVKPPPIRVGVSGIDSSTQFGNKPNKNQINPQHMSFISKLPKFQMFASEKLGLSTANVDTWMDKYLSNNRDNLQAIYDEYCVWHDNKGHWVGETPDGRIINQLR